jgi:nitrilase
MTSDGRVRVAVVQDAPVLFDEEGTLAKLDRLTGTAAGRGAQLILFPEAFLGGYPFGLTFGAVLGYRTAEGHEQYRRYWDQAMTVPGSTLERLCEIARAHDVYLVVGVVERAGGTLYCTALFVGRDGSLLGRHRKLMPTGLERLVWGLGDGSTLPVIDTEVGKLGAVICWENYMPLLRAAMYAKGIEIYCAPTLDDLDSWIHTVRHIAKEGRVFVLSACQYLRRSDCPDDYPVVGENPDDVLFRGGSCIVSPTGELLAAPNYEGPAILDAELDLGEIGRGKYDLDVVGHYSRPDIFRLEVDERARPSLASAPDCAGPPGA